MKEMVLSRTRRTGMVELLQGTLEFVQRSFTKYIEASTSSRRKLLEILRFARVQDDRR